jgi:hypothetical protein
MAFLQDLHTGWSGLMSAVVPDVRNERAEWIGGEMVRMPAQGLLWRSNPAEGSPARELGPTTAYSLEVDKGGGWRSPRKVPGRENPQ